MLKAQVKRLNLSFSSDTQESLSELSSLSFSAPTLIDRIQSLVRSTQELLSPTPLTSVPDTHPNLLQAIQELLQVHESLQQQNKQLVKLLVKDSDKATRQEDILPQSVLETVPATRETASSSLPSSLLQK